MRSSLVGCRRQMFGRITSRVRPVSRSCVGVATPIRAFATGGSAKPALDSKSFFRLDGRVALVTGGGQSVGEAIAQRLSAAGARVAIFDQNSAHAARVAAALGGGSRAVAVTGDVTSESDIERAVRETAKALGGPIDILVNNAGITGNAACLWDLKQSELDRVMAVNVTGPFLFSRAVLGRPAGGAGGGAATGMFARGWGRIVNIASISGKEGNPTLIPYSASKSALINMTKALAKEVAGRPLQSGDGKVDICVNAISPAVIRTAMVDAMPIETVNYMISKIPMGRTCTKEEVASLVHFLSSNECSFTNGQCVDISGARATY